MKENQNLYEMFIDELEDMLSSANQIIETLPDLINMTTSKDLKKVLTIHYEETKDQVERIEKIFFILESTAWKEF